MVTLGTAIILALALITLGLLIASLIRQRWLARDSWLIDCPETESYTSVRLSEEPARLGTLFDGGTQPHVVDCEQWPAHYGCAQTCVRRPAKEAP